MTIRAVYENGVFKPLETVTLAEGTRADVVIETPPLSPSPSPAEALARIAALPREGPDDGFSGADHDQVLYGWGKK